MEKGFYSLSNTLNAFGVLRLQAKELKYQINRLDNHFPHNKGYITTITPVEPTQERHRWGTAGEDHKLVLWDLDRDQWRNSSGVTTRILHRLHTARINDLLYQESTQRFFSGGSDRRLIIYDAAAGKAINNVEQRTVEYGIRNLHFIPDQPQTLLLSLMEQEAFRLWDTRAGRTVSVLSAMPRDEQDKARTTLELSGDVHPNGWLVAQGKNGNSNQDGHVALWDLRYSSRTVSEIHKSSIVTKQIKVSVCDPVQIHDTHDKKIRALKFWKPQAAGSLNGWDSGPGSLLTLSHGKSLKVGSLRSRSLVAHVYQQFSSFDLRRLSFMQNYLGMEANSQDLILTPINTETPQNLWFPLKETFSTLYLV